MSTSGITVLDRMRLAAVSPMFIFRTRTMYAATSLRTTGILFLSLRFLQLFPLCSAYGAAVWEGINIVSDLIDLP